MGQTSVFRSTLLVAFLALLEAVVAPYLSFGWTSPRLVLLGVVVAAWGMQDTQGVLLGFFGGILTDALGGSFFGVGALGGLLAGALAVRVGHVLRKGPSRPLVAQVVAVSVAAYDLIYLAATGLAGLEGPSIGSFVVAGVIPDALLNGLLVYVLAGWLTRLIRVKGGK